MSYETHTWESGEMITAEKLNHIEDGIEECCSGGSSNVPLMVGETMTETEVNGINTKVYTLDKTWQEIYDAFARGALVIIDGKKIAVLVTNNAPHYTVLAGNNVEYRAISADDYPESEVRAALEPFPPEEEG